MDKVCCKVPEIITERLDWIDSEEKRFRDLRKDLSRQRREAQEQVDRLNRRIQQCESLDRDYGDRLVALDHEKTDLQAFITWHEKASMRRPVVRALANKVNLWAVKKDGTLYYEVHRQPFPSDGSEPVILIKGHAQREDWYWEDPSEQTVTDVTLANTIRCAIFNGDSDPKDMAAYLAKNFRILERR